MGFYKAPEMLDNKHTTSTTIINYNNNMLSPITKTERQKINVKLVYPSWIQPLAESTSNIALASSMEDDYLSRYEVADQDKVVDQDKSDHSHKNIAESDGYERLINDVNSIQEEY